MEPYEEKHAELTISLGGEWHTKFILCLNSDFYKDVTATTYNVIISLYTTRFITIWQLAATLKTINADGPACSKKIYEIFEGIEVIQSSWVWITSWTQKDVSDLPKPLQYARIQGVLYFNLGTQWNWHSVFVTQRSILEVGAHAQWIIRGMHPARLLVVENAFALWWTLYTYPKTGWLALLSLPFAGLAPWELL